MQPIRTFERTAGRRSGSLSAGPSGRLLGAMLAALLAACSSASAASEPMPPPPIPEAAAGPAEATPPGPQQRTSVEPGQGDVQAVVPTETMVMRDPQVADTVQAGRFDQGKMWTFEYPPVEYLLETYGLTPDSIWWRTARLGALRIPSCSASFVSPYGLVLTNHHCAREFVSQVSEEGEDLLDNGFFARTLAEEREVEEFEADQLIEIVDITAEVMELTRGLTGADLSEGRDNVLDEISRRMQEERGGEEEGWVVEAISLYNGARASAYVFRRYGNAKLVMAPELQIGSFGGDPDNFTYPRYDLDFAFFRIYDDDGDPIENESFFPWATEGVEKGDLIFIVGNPGSTSRLQTVTQLEFRRDVSDAAVLDFIKRRIEVVADFVAAYPEVAEEHDLRNLLFSLQNQRKAMEGQLAGMADPMILARRQAAERELIDSLSGDPALLQEYGTVFEEMAEVQTELRGLEQGFRAFLGLTAGEFASSTLHRALIAFQILNGQRGGASPDQLTELMDELRAVADKPPELEEGFIEARILEFIEQYGEDSWVQGILQGRSPEGAATVIREGSVLSDSAAAVAAAERGALEPSDPGIEVVLAYLQAFGEFQGGIGPGLAREEELAGKIGLARYEVYGTSQPPDATFSLRIADGVVDGYPYNGTRAPVYTTFYGMLDRYHSFLREHGQEADNPWALPEAWLSAPASFDLSTPVNFVSTADIIGGNSGSPVLNRDLEVVGVVFDGNIESLPGDYIYLPELNRSVAVDARGILEALEQMYGMQRIAEELTTGGLVTTSGGPDGAR